MADTKVYYDREFLGDDYARAEAPETHPHVAEVRGFVERFGLRDRKCLEVGSGRGAFQDLVDDYTGLDIAESVHRYYHKPFIQGSATALPFDDNSFDGIWTVSALEHVPEPEKALMELRRVLRPGGVILLSPAWFCPPWGAEGYSVRPFSDFGWKGKLIKASIPVRKSVAFRSLYVFPRRLLRFLTWRFCGGPQPLRYRRLKPNYERHWTSDSDACNCMDPYDAIIWFRSRGDECLSHPRWMNQMLARNRGLVFRIGK